jgi:hypothetical protein
VAALRLPERLTQISTRYYSACDLNSWLHPNAGAKASHDTRLRGVFCVSAAEAAVAVDAGADFIALREALSPNELTALCHSLPVSVFARGIELEQAWALGSSGLNEICT